ncbi:MAG TPA: flippase activity-associated protein Agl23, partial [Roseiflexaceae bacterium]|nr:flippase activity-associated protein Agl23 [Roseiflexaceae bacterium]
MASIPRETRDYRVPAVLDRTIDLSRINLEVVAFVVVALLSVIAHLWALGHMALHHDESIHAWSSWRFYTGAGSFTCAAGRTAGTYCYDPVFHGPSLYSLTLLSYLLFGDGEAQARLPMAIAGILLVASAWMLRPYFGRRGTLIAAVLLAFTPSLLYFTRFARHDGLMVLWEFWMVVGFFRWLDSGRARWLYLLSVGTALAIATHELYYILFFLFGMFVLIRVLTELLPGRRLAIALIAILTVSLVIMLANPPITDKLRSGGPALIIATIVGTGLLMMRVWDDTPILTARALVLWRHQRGVLFTALGILAAIYVLLYSTYFADPRGIIDGLYQGISYWLFSQHDYARGDQPWYYYLMLTPLYEPLALVMSIGASIYLFTRRRPATDQRPTT